MPALVFCASGVAQRVEVSQCGVAGVNVTASPAAEYFEQVDQVLGATRSDKLNAWLPFGVAITNRSTQNIVAVAVRWVVHGGAGPDQTFTASPHMFDQPRQQVLSGKTVIALPVALLGTSKLPAQFQLTPPAGLITKPGHLGDFQTAASVQVTLDGVVFASGQFVGPDSAREYEELVVESTVPAHVASAVVAMKASGETIATVVAWLEAKTKAPARPLDRTAQLAAQTAKTLLLNYHRGGEALLYEVAQGYAQGPGIKLYR